MRFEEALACFDDALLVKPDFVDAFCNRASALFELGRIDDALKFFEIALSLDAGHAMSWSNRGHALAAINRLDEAAESYEKALALAPDLADASEALAELRAAQQQGGAAPN
jgi:tetratricopeptide (TPR) repeat protein